MKKAIFTDIDNTILPKGHTKLSLKTIQTFKKALDLGYEVFLISGRPIKYVEYLAKSIDDRVKAIGFNGNYSDRFIDNPIKKDILLDTFKNILADNSNFVYKSRLDLFSNYKQKPQNIDVYWTNALTAKLTKYINFSFIDTFLKYFLFDSTRICFTMIFFIYKNIDNER